jgi:predicted outer membrane repeat protein
MKNKIFKEKLSSLTLTSSITLFILGLSITGCFQGTTMVPSSADTDRGLSRSVRMERVQEARVRIVADKEIINEGEKGLVRIFREGKGGDLLLHLEVSGEAVFGKDYLIRGIDSFKTTHALVTIPSYKNFVYLTVEAKDDIPAESDERLFLTLIPGMDYWVDPSLKSVSLKIPQNDFIVTTTLDAGEGSLRQAILNANTFEGLDTIRFDSTIGPFATPQTITLIKELPHLTGEVAINGYIKDRLWKPTGVRVSGGNQNRVFTVTPGARATVSYLTVAEGRAKRGGGIANRGDLVIKSVTFADNTAIQDGGGLANLGGKVTVINSTFAYNRADISGGGMANDSGNAIVTNCTFSSNTARKGGGLFSAGKLLLRNTILANSEAIFDCEVTGILDPGSTNNLIEANNGCGNPISTADPNLGDLKGYNGPTHTFPLGGGSPAINLGDNSSAVDEHGKPLRWDQRGNGDPRFVAGITDIGAFERQVFPVLMVDTVEDTELRACTRAGKADCSLRGAITLVNATGKHNVITFDPKIFSFPRTIHLAYSLPDVVTDMTIDARETGGVTVQGDFVIFRTVPDANLSLYEIIQKNTKQ